MTRALVATLVAALPGVAAAAAGEQAVSVGLRYGALTLPGNEEGDDDLELDGGVLVLEWERGLGDTYGVRAHVAAGAYDGTSAGTPYGGAAAIGGVYRFDVLRAVPYLQASVGAIAAAGDGLSTVKPTIELGCGLDFLESRSFGWGLALSWDALASEARFLTIGLRASWRWGWF